jgi:hypothetical protein
MVATFIIALSLITLSGVMLDMHRRSWRQAELDTTLSNVDRRYALSQFRRRMQASGIIGVIGATIAIGPLVPHRPWPFLLYLLSIAGPCLAIVVLAGMDAWATRQHFARLQSQSLAAQLKLAREMSGKSEGGAEQSVRVESN